MCSINLKEGPLRGEMAEIYVHIHSFNESSSYIKEKMELLGNSSETMPYTFSSIIACKNTHTNTHTQYTQTSPFTPLFLDRNHRGSKCDKKDFKQSILPFREVNCLVWCQTDSVKAKSVHIL